MAERRLAKFKTDKSSGYRNQAYARAMRGNHAGS